MSSAIVFPSSFCSVSVKIVSNPDSGEGVGAKGLSGGGVGCEEIVVVSQRLKVSKT